MLWLPGSFYTGYLPFNCKHWFIENFCVFFFLMGWDLLLTIWYDTLLLGVKFISDSTSILINLNKSRLLRVWYIVRSTGLGHTYRFRSCLVWIMRFAKILCHDVDSLNTDGVPQTMSFAGSSRLHQWSHTCDPFVFIKQKKSQQITILKLRFTMNTRKDLLELAKCIILCHFILS